MADIRKCWDCKEPYYMDNGSQCICCDAEFCRVCDTKNGKNVYSEKEEHYYYICNDCMEQGVKHVNDFNVDDVEFTQKGLDKI